MTEEHENEPPKPFTPRSIVQRLADNLARRPAPHVVAPEEDDAGEEHYLDKQLTVQDIVTSDMRVKTFMQRPCVRQRKFDDRAAALYLGYYALTGRKGDSAVASGVSYSTVNRWYKENDVFAELCHDAHQEWLNILEREAYRRGVEGVWEPVVGGKDPVIVTYVKKYSDRLLEKLMNKADPEGYGNRASTDVNVNVNTGVLRVPEPTTIEGTAIPIEDVDG